MKKIVLSVVALMLAGAAQATEPAPGSICPKHMQHRTTEQVLQDHLAALMTGNAELIACDYADDAYLILPGSVATGIQEITAAFGSFMSLLGSTSDLQMVSTTIAGELVLAEWHWEGEHVVVGDGVDTLVIRDGLIVAQTVRLGDLSPR